MSSITLTELLEKFQGFSWEDRIGAMAPLRKGGRIITLSGNSFRLTPHAVSRFRREFRRQICEYNRSQPLQRPIRSIYSGEFVLPGTRAYTRTLRICRLERIHSTCREILAAESSFPHPRTGKPVLSHSKLGGRLRRKCQ
jgi:hypothetical protein